MEKIEQLLARRSLRRDLDWTRHTWLHLQNSHVHWISCKSWSKWVQQAGVIRALHLLPFNRWIREEKGTREGKLNTLRWRMCARDRQREFRDPLVAAVISRTSTTKFGIASKNDEKKMSSDPEQSKKTKKKTGCLRCSANPQRDLTRTVGEEWENYRPAHGYATERHVLTNRGEEKRRDICRSNCVRACVCVRRSAVGLLLTQVVESTTSVCILW